MLRGPNDPPPRPHDRRKLGIVLCAIAVVLLAYSSFSRRWLEAPTGGDDHIGFSLIAFETCDGNDCKATSNFALVAELSKRKYRSDRDRPSSAFAPLGLLTMGLSLLALLALGASAVLAYKGIRYRIPPTTIALLALLVALILGCLFVASKPGGYGAVGVGPSFWAFAVACVVGILGAQMLARLVRPLDPDLPPDLPSHAEV